VKTKKTWQEKLANDHGLPEVKPIPERMRKRAGPGTIVIPAPREVDELMRGVPNGRVTTISTIAATLADRHRATIGCTVTTGIFAWIAAHAADEREAAEQARVTPYWRVLKEGGELNAKYPGGIANLRKRLEAEGHTVVPDGKRFRVEGFERKLAKP
jgi:alkylated DNA nucleotide flippase Atl1